MIQVLLINTALTLLAIWLAGRGYLWLVRSNPPKALTFGYLTWAFSCLAIAIYFSLHGHRNNPSQIQGIIARGVQYDLTTWTVYGIFIYVFALCPFRFFQMFHRNRVLLNGSLSATDLREIGNNYEILANVLIHLQNHHQDVGLIEFRIHRGIHTLEWVGLRRPIVLIPFCLTQDDGGHGLLLAVGRVTQLLRSGAAWRYFMLDLICLVLPVLKNLARGIKERFENKVLSLPPPQRRPLVIWARFLILVPVTACLHATYLVGPIHTREFIDLFNAALPSNVSQPCPRDGTHVKLLPGHGGELPDGFQINTIGLSPKEPMPDQFVISTPTFRPLPDENICMIEFDCIVESSPTHEGSPMFFVGFSHWERNGPVKTLEYLDADVALLNHSGHYRVTTWQDPSDPSQVVDDTLIVPRGHSITLTNFKFINTKGTRRNIKDSRQNALITNTTNVIRSSRPLSNDWNNNKAYKPL